MAEDTLVAPQTGELRMEEHAKEERYAEVLRRIRAVVEPENDLLACLASTVCLLHHAFPYYFWTGFYRRVGPELLRVGPYQGTLGCVDIPFGRGVCGTSAARGETLIVDDVDTFPGHIACDSASRSEIVVPVYTGDRLIGVLDVDSTLKAAFDQVDRHWLEEIAALVGGKETPPVVWREGLSDPA
ncbi:MAG: GAF domain-containing protein [Longimicrobiaceae bacterium]